MTQAAPFLHAPCLLMLGVKQQHMGVFMCVLESPQCTPVQGWGFSPPLRSIKLPFTCLLSQTSSIRHLIQGRFSSNFKAAFHLNTALNKAFQAVFFKQPLY